MTMNRRDLLKLAPLAALVPVAVKIGGVEAQAHELKPDKKYVFVFNGEVEPETLEACSRAAKQEGIHGMWVAGPGLNLELYELK